MRRPGHLWRHVTINTYCSWLHGDPRGFRCRNHNIHSSGDYKNPPPKGEHSGLHKYFKKISAQEVHIDRELRPVVGRAIVGFLREERHPLLALAVGKVHTHFLVELPEDLGQVRSICGHAKRKSSRAVKKQLPGTVWAAGGTYKRVKDRTHQKNSYEYVLYEQGPGAWTWSFRDKSDQGMFERKRPAGKTRGGAGALPRRGRNTG